MANAKIDIYSIHMTYTRYTQIPVSLRLSISLVGLSFESATTDARKHFSKKKLPVIIGIVFPSPWGRWAQWGLFLEIPAKISRQPGFKSCRNAQA
jgi:hypothetical protein